MIVCDDHYEAEWFAEELDSFLTKECALGKIPASKVLKFHTQTPSKALRRASQRMTVRSALGLLPPELTFSARKKPRLRMFKNPRNFFQKTLSFNKIYNIFNLDRRFVHC